MVAFHSFCGKASQKEDRMAKQNWKGSTLLGPMPPVMVSCGTQEHPNIITIAWTGIVNTVPPKTYISVRPQRHSYALIRENGEFTINLTPTKLIRAADYCVPRPCRIYRHCRTTGSQTPRRPSENRRFM
jgi:flavin reductase (DIM6/NTAB) family NADH-FMN oxidoreductase RutF